MNVQKQMFTDNLDTNLRCFYVFVEDQQISTIKL